MPKDFCGCFAAGKAVVTELAARLVLLTYNLWSLFTRLMGLTPGQHTEAIKSRRNFLFLAVQVVTSGRQRTLKLAVTAEWWQVLKRLLRKAADLVGGSCAAVGIPRQLSPPPLPPNNRCPLGMARSTPADTDRLNLNCGF